ncbi:hypothetical protein [Phytohabitans kaempferiae]|uniref:Uncharacterized protein n=1 Tax=Phytohabitans kaempferiae TaxID=1620943 RepID=A0ABV6LW13_9ACTN
MLLPTSMIMAETATRQHVLSARPKAPTISAHAPRRRRSTTRRLTAGVLRRLADRIEPRRVYNSAPVS